MPLVAADVAWVLMATALVLLMTPALGFFYGGLVRSKNALNTMMMSVCALGFVGVAWALLGYSLAFAPGNAAVGGLSYVFLRGVGLEAQGTIPQLLFMAYQGTFAIITAALISGAVVERMRFGALPDLPDPVEPRRLRAGRALGVGRRVPRPARRPRLRGRHRRPRHRRVPRRWWPRSCWARARTTARLAFLPHNVAFTLLGAGLLWFGWFGFNAGSALAANASAALAFVNTMLAPAAALVAWTLLDLRRTGKATAVGAATAIVVGLVAVTPAAGYVSPLGAMALGVRRHVPELLRPPVAGADAARRLAGRGGRPRPRRHGRRAAHRRPRPEGLERRRRRPALRQPAAARGAGAGRRRRDGLQRRRDLRPPEAHRRLHARCARRPAARGSGWT